MTQDESSWYNFELLRVNSELCSLSPECSLVYFAQNLRAKMARVSCGESRAPDHDKLVNIPLSHSHVFSFVEGTRYLQNCFFGWLQHRVQRRTPHTPASFVLFKRKLLIIRCGLVHGLSSAALYPFVMFERLCSFLYISKAAFPTFLFHFSDS